jgi:hypothetical protein
MRKRPGAGYLDRAAVSLTAAIDQRGQTGGGRPSPAGSRPRADGLPCLFSGQVRHRGTGGHPLTGQRVPDLELEGGPAPSVFGLLPTAHFVLLDLTGGRLGLPGAGERAARLEVVAGRLADQRPEWASVQAVLIRPDGHVAWATDDPDRAGEQARLALARWLDPERAPLPSVVSSASSVNDRARSVSVHV